MTKLGTMKRWDGTIYEGRWMNEGAAVEVRAISEHEGGDDSWYYLNRRAMDVLSAVTLFSDWINGEDDTLCIVV